MVNPISFPTPQAWSGGADFSMLANLGNVYQKAQDRAREQTALGMLGQGVDADTAALLHSGVPALAQIGLNLQQRAIDQKREDARYSITDARANAQLAIQQAAAKREQETYLKADQDEAAAAKLIAGLKPAPSADVFTRGAPPVAPVAAAVTPPPPDMQAAPQAAPPVAPSPIAPAALGATGAMTASVPIAANLTSGQPAADISRDQLAELYRNPLTRNIATAFLQKQFSPEEARAKTRFEQEQKFATREGRLQAAKEGELDITDPVIRKWVALGGDIPTAARAGLGQPVYTRDAATGKLTLNQLSSAGGLVPTVLPPGQEVLGPGEVAQQRAQGGAVGKAQGNAIVNLPKVETDAQLVLDTIDKALAPHAGKAWSVGTMFKDVPALPGSATANYRAILDQLDSQTFLEAYNSLKGGGAISNYEDKRASQAKARLSRAQSPEEFDNALREYKEIVQSGVAHARQLAGREANPVASAKPDPFGLR